jgi:hypothetical protein
MANVTWIEALIYEFEALQQIQADHGRPSRHTRPLSAQMTRTIVIGKTAGFRTNPLSKGNISDQTYRGILTANWSFGGMPAVRADSENAAGMRWKIAKLFLVNEADRTFDSVHIAWENIF